MQGSIPISVRKTTTQSVSSNINNEQVNKIWVFHWNDDSPNPFSDYWISFLSGFCHRFSVMRFRLSLWDLMGRTSTWHWYKCLTSGYLKSKVFVGAIMLISVNFYRVLFKSLNFVWENDVQSRPNYIHLHKVMTKFCRKQKISFHDDKPLAVIIIMMIFGSTTWTLRI